MKKIYIDTENISDYECLNTIGITSKDEIILFLSQNSKHLKPSNLYILLSFNSKIRALMFKVDRPNALDFHIVSHLGLKFSNKHEYFIVSNDRGFETVVHHYNLLNYNNVNLINEVKSIDNVLKLIDDEDLTIDCDYLSEKDIDALQILKNVKNKNNFHNALTRKYGDEEGRLLYLKYRSDFDKIKKKKNSILL